MDEIDDRFLQIAATTRRHDASLIPPEVAAMVLARRGVLTPEDLATADPNTVRGIVTAASTRWIYEPPPPGGLPLWRSRDVLAGWAAYALVAQDDDGVRTALRAAAGAVPERVERAQRLLETVVTWIDEARAEGASVKQVAAAVSGVLPRRSAYGARVVEGQHGDRKARFVSLTVGDLVLVVAHAAERAADQRPGFPLYAASAAIAGDERQLSRHLWVYDESARTVARDPTWYADPRAGAGRLRRMLRSASTYRSWRPIGRTCPIARELALQHVAGATSVPDDAAPWQLTMAVVCDPVYWEPVVFDGVRRLVMIGLDPEGRTIVVSDDDFVCTPRPATSPARLQPDEFLVVNDLALPLARDQSPLLVEHEPADLGLAALIAPLLD